MKLYVFTFDCKTHILTQSELQVRETPKYYIVEGEFNSMTSTVRLGVYIPSRISKSSTDVVREYLGKYYIVSTVNSKADFKNKIEHNIIGQLTKKLNEAEFYRNRLKTVREYIYNL